MRVKYDLKIKQNVKEYKVDILLLTFTILCFTAFGYGSIKFKEMSGIGGPVAQLTQGQVDRKTSEESLYKTISPPAELLNMDNIWVGKRGSATLLMEHGAEIELSEKTFIILKRPFKNTKRDEDQIVVLKGTVRVKPKNFDKEQLFTPEKIQPTLPSQDAPPAKSKSQLGIYPTDNVILYMRPEKAAELTFAWPDLLTGYLVIENKRTSQASYVEVKNQRSVKTNLEQNTPYFWQVIDENHNVLVGPFRFDLNVLTDDIPRTAKEKGPRPVEIIWE